MVVRDRGIIMAHIEAQLANAKAIETRGKILIAKGLRAQGAVYIEMAAKMLADIAYATRPLPLAA